MKGIETVAVGMHNVYGKCLIKEFDRKTDRCLIAISGTTVGYKRLKASIVQSKGILTPVNEVAKKMMELTEKEEGYKKILHLKSGQTKTVYNEKDYKLICELETVERVDHVRGSRK